MEVLRAHDGEVGEPERHGGVMGDHAALPEQQDALVRRVVRHSACGSPWSTLRPAHAVVQQEVDGHLPARPEMSPDTQPVRPNALAPLRKSSIALHLLTPMLPVGRRSSADEVTNFRQK